jgi:hypothetical protein
VEDSTVAEDTAAVADMAADTGKFACGDLKRVEL